MTGLKETAGLCRDALERCLGAAVPADRILREVPMSLHTSFRIGGPADYLVTVESPAELSSVLECCERSGTPFLLLGRGTNILVRDGGMRGVVLRLAGEFLDVSYEGPEVEAGAAVPLSELARDCGRKGLSGLEFAVGIPGTVGGAVVMNAGAYEREMRDVVESAVVFRPGGPGRGRPERLSARDLDFGYRTSRPQREGWIVLSARFGLEPGDPVEIRRREEDYTERRRARQPLDLPSAGSAFKRPPGGYAGTLIEASGCRGLRVGDAQVSERHAGFVVNLGAATATDVLELMRRVRDAVYERFGVWLEPEIRVVGEDLPDEGDPAL
ncbi:MAG: UDP-N-acetylmuramate dehydrogenase [Bacillota bacterium]